MNSSYLLTVSTMVGDTDTHVRATPSAKRFFAFLVSVLCFFKYLLEVISAANVSCRKGIQSQEQSCEANVQN